MCKALKSVANYVGNNLIHQVQAQVDPRFFLNGGLRTAAQDATNTDPGDVVRNVAGDGAADTLHGVVNTVAPAILSAFLSPAAGAAFTTASNYGNGGSLGSSLGKGALSLGSSYAGNAIGGLAAGGGSSSFSPSSLFGSGSSGTFGGGAKDFGNLFNSTPSGSLSSSLANTGSIDDIGSNIGSNSASLGTASSAVPDAASGFNVDLGNATTGGNKVLGNIGLGRALAGAAGGVGQGLAINQAQKDQLKAIAGQQENLNSFDPSGITQDPGYQFQFDQGNQALQRQLAAAGGTQSGAALKAAQQYGQNYANTAFNDYYQRWANETGAQNQLLAGKGNVQSNAILGQGQNLSQTLNNVFNPGQGNSLADILKQLASQ